MACIVAKLHQHYSRSKMVGFGEQKKKKKSSSKGNTQVGGEVFHKTAVDYHMRGDLVSAEKAYRAAIKTGYSHPAIYTNLGVICKNSERAEEAILLYEKAIEVSPNNPDAYTNIGSLYKKFGQLDQALAATLKSLELKPDNPTPHTILGGIYQDLGQLDQALEATLKSLELKPDNPDAHMSLGGIYKELGQLDQGLEATLKSLELKPDNADAHMNLGGIYKELGQLDQALAATLKSLELRPNHSTSLINLAVVYKSKSAELFKNNDINTALKILKSYSGKPFMPEKLKWEFDMSVKSCVLAQASYCHVKTNTIAKDLIFSGFRTVDKDLLIELQSIEIQELSKRVSDPRYGNGYCTNYQLFTRTTPAILRLEKDLMSAARKLLDKEICSFKYESFFNVYNAGAGIVKHSHLGKQDYEFDLWRHKFSLVYYLDPGSQNAKNPGILRFYDPDVQLLPSKGLIAIFPANRMHSAFYDGSKSRLMVGVNFFAF